MSLKSNFLFMLIVFLLFSCDKKRVFDDYKSVGNSWNKDSLVSFDLPKLDTKKEYNLFINLRDNNDYPFNNIFLIVSMSYPDGITKIDTLEYQMADAEGNLLGDGFSDVKESKLVFKEREKFKNGKHKVTIKHAARQTGKVTGIDKLEGITEVGFRIETVE